MASTQFIAALHRPVYLLQRRILRHIFLFLFVGVSASSCVSHHVSPYLDYAPQPGFIRSGDVPSNRSVVIFSRPDDIRALSTLLFDGDKFLTILTELTYFVYETTPGRHHFVSRVTGRGLSFMDAQLAPQKIYFAAVKYGEANNAWFELIPIVPNSEYWKDLPQWLLQSKEVRPNASAFKWFEARRVALIAEQDANQSKARRYQMLENHGVDRAP